MDKLKGMASKVTGKGGSSSSSSGESSESGTDKYVTKGVDMATDKAGMGDKYDEQISDQVNKQIDNYQQNQQSKLHTDIVLRLTGTIESNWPLVNENTKLHIEAANPSNFITTEEARQLLKQIAHVLRRRYDIGAEGRLGEDVVLTITSGSPILPILFYGIVAAGGVLSGVGTALRIGEMVHQLKDAEARVILCSPEYEKLTTQVAKQCGIPQENILVIDSVRRRSWTLRTLSGNDVLQENNHLALPWKRITDRQTLESTTVAIMYSSGTTGLPKGVRLSHTNIISSAICSMDVARRYKAQHPEFTFDTIAHLPFSNIAGIDMYCTNPIYMGGSTYWMKSYDFESFVEYHRQFRPAYQFTVPPIWLRIAKSDQVTDHFDGLQVAVTGSAPIGEATVKEIRSKLGKGRATIAQTWGITEATGVITAMDWGDENWSVGDLIPNTRLRMVDDNEKDIPAGEEKPGEMLISGPIVAQGYHKRPEVTNEAFVDGWYHSGDIGITKEGGRHFIVDRKKELIKYKGSQVAPAELEALLTSHESIADAAVIGIWQADQDTEVPRAYVVKKAPISAKAIMDFVKDNLAPYKQLRGGVIFVGEIPKSASGKILRKELRDREKKAPVTKL